MKTKQLSEQLHDVALAVLSSEAVSEYRQTRLAEAVGLLREAIEFLPDDDSQIPPISALVLHRIKKFLEISNHD